MLPPANGKQFWLARGILGEILKKQSECRMTHVRASALAALLVLPNT